MTLFTGSGSVTMETVDLWPQIQDLGVVGTLETMDV